MKTDTNEPFHTTKMAAMPIYCNHYSISIEKFDDPEPWLHLGIGSFIICSNDDLVLNLIFSFQNQSWLFKPYMRKWFDSGFYKNI